ncbi:MAG: FtsX-like permease family protein [Acidobacteria bacterium]|nr:FtsX-like permease family protein [Acidobacteriota bacterium]
MSAPLAFAWRSLVRQPPRSTLGVLGVAAVGALLLDMLLLSEGLILSMRELLDRLGYDVRVTASDALPGMGAAIEGAPDAVAAIAALPAVRAVTPIRSEDAELAHRDRQVTSVLLGVGGTAPVWTILRGRDPENRRDLVINRYAAETLGVEPGATVTLRASCSHGPTAPPPVEFRVSGVAELPFDTPETASAAARLVDLEDACGAPGAGVADFLAVTSAGDAAAAAVAIGAARPDLRAFTNDQLIGRVQQTGFTYFRQISTVLATITMAFALLLITVLLTVSVNQRLGEVAALRALGFSQRRVVLDVLCESALIVGTGGVLSVPLGIALARWLDTILKRMPGIPEQMHFFVFEPQALLFHAGLLAATALLAAAYPMRIVARLPIAATLRNEVIS